MATPFPGMDPYLEHPALWPGVHTRLLVELGKQLAPRIRPRYVVSVEERIFVEVPGQQKIPDLWVQQSRNSGIADEGGVATVAEVEVTEPVFVKVERLNVREHYIQILDLYRNQKVVSVVELVSPSNKKPGAGRRSYRRKQRSTLASETHLVEIDLLRTGEHVLAVPRERISDAPHYDYLICVSRWPQREGFELYPLQLESRLPRFRIPLAEPDEDVTVDLQTALEQVNDDGSYVQRVKYDEPCVPSLTDDRQNWAVECLSHYRERHPEFFPSA